MNTKTTVARYTVCGRRIDGIDATQVLGHARTVQGALRIARKYTFHPARNNNARIYGASVWVEDAGGATYSASWEYLHPSGREALVLVPCE